MRFGWFLKSSLVAAIGTAMPAPAATIIHNDAGYLAAGYVYAAVVEANVPISFSIDWDAIHSWRYEYYLPDGTMWDVWESTVAGGFGNGVSYTDKALGGMIIKPSLNTTVISNTEKLSDWWSTYANFHIYNAPENAVVVFRITNLGAVPEPATWAMMIAGFGLAGAAMRRTRRQAAFMPQAS